jgi:hypothetical protein
MPFYRPVHTGPLAKLVPYFCAAALRVVRILSRDFFTLELLNFVSARVKEFDRGK